MDRAELREGGLLLRPWRPDDAAEVCRACQDPEIRRWTSIPSPYLREHAVGFVKSHTQRAWAAQTSAPMGVFDASTGELLGSGGLVRLDLVAGTGEIGYWVAPWARGRGVATGAVRAIARWAFQRLGLRRLEWRAEVGNHASRLVAVRVGVQVEGVARQSLIRSDGTRVDGWTGSLLPRDLRESTRPAAVPPEHGSRPAGVPDDDLVGRRAAVFAGPQPRLVAVTDAGERLALRRPQPLDIDSIAQSCRDPESARWTTIPHPYQRIDAEFFVHDHAPRIWSRGAGGVFAIVGPDDSYAGSMELRIPPSDTASPAAAAQAVGDVGYLVAPWARHRGYATAALRALCAWGFDALALERVEWRAYLGNEASRRVAEHAGFTVEGIARAGCSQRGEKRDAWIGAMLSTDRTLAVEISDDH